MMPLGRLALLALLTPASVLGDDNMAMSSSANTTATDGTMLPPDGPLGPHDHHFKPKDSNNSTSNSSELRGGRGGFGVRGAGGHLQLCPTGDCSQSVIDLSMHHLHEVTGADVVTANRVKDLSGLTFNWTSPVTALNAEGVNVTSSFFNASLPIDGVALPVSFRTQVSFYQSNGTAQNGEQIIDVPGGGLKFAVWIDSWPFADATNKLRLGLQVLSRNKSGGRTPRGNCTKGTGRDKKIDRVELQSAMFLDSPALAQIDAAMVTINSSVAVLGDVIMVEYEFPKFASLYYDPVVSSSEDLSTTGTTAEVSSNTNLRSMVSSPLKAFSPSALLMTGVATTAALLVSLLA